MFISIAKIYIKVPWVGTRKLKWLINIIVPTFDPNKIGLNPEY